jgi:hypothetical protein
VPRRRFGLADPRHTHEDQAKDGRFPNHSYYSSGHFLLYGVQTEWGFKVEIIQVPRAAQPYIAYQRQGYGPRIFGKLEKKLGHRIYRHLVHPLLALTNPRFTQQKFTAEMYDIYSTFSHMLPKNIDRVLDIGSGMGGINVPIFRHHGAPEIWLLDKDGVSPRIKNGYHQSATTFSHYNSFRMALDLLERNGISGASVHTVDIAREPFPNDEFDLVYSFISWGFHYPVETYLDAVHSALMSGGLLVLDLRKGTSGISVLQERFQTDPVIVHSETKFDRVAVRKTA